MHESAWSLYSSTARVTRYLFIYGLNIAHMCLHVKDFVLLCISKLYPL